MSNKPRAHAEVIKAWADGAEIQYRKDAGMMWTDSADPAFVADYEYRVKPAQDYPETRLRDGELCTCYPVAASHAVMLRYVANTALRHAIDAGQVVQREEFNAVADELEKVKGFFGSYPPGSLIKVNA